MGTTHLKYFRLDSSPYQKAEFFQKEYEMFKSLGVEKGENPFDSEILISNTHTDFNKIPLVKLKKTKLILHPNSGYDNIPTEFVREASFPILRGNSIRAHGVAEFTLSKVFQHFCPLEDSQAWDNTRAWDRKLLREQNVFILGLGMIGTLLEQSLRPLVNKIQVHDPFQGHHNSEPIDIDIVLLASSLNKTSERFVDKDFLNKLNPDWLLVNGARGKLVDQKDLLESLRAMKGATAFLDVFESEPFRSEEFSNVPNLYKSSHVAGVSRNLDDLIIDFERDCTTKFITHRSNQPAFETHFKELLLKNKLSKDISFLV
ncbi:MAG: D-3-phosphoglycerate dehydrogenase [Bacteriovoracaceae bacterium]|jgi:D-3-phosphoglycerate dehydrogenase